MGYLSLAKLEVHLPNVTCNSVSVAFTTNTDTQCRMDTGSFTDCKSPYHESGLHGGLHTVTIKTSDGLRQESVSFIISGLYVCTCLHTYMPTYFMYAYMHTYKRMYIKLTILYSTYDDS